MFGFINGITLRGCRLQLLSMSAVLMFVASSRAATLFYNGDYDLNDAATNENNVPINKGGTYQLEKALVYNNFIVPAGQTWSLTSVFSNNQIAYSATPTTAVWEIRTGVSSGNGGTLRFSGDTAATETLKTAADGNNYIANEYSISATVSNVVLTSGTYWLAVAPDSNGYYGDQSYNETTKGANAVGMPKGNDGNSFLFNNLTGAGNLNFAPSSLDYSAGVNGTVTLTPEPTGAPIIAVTVGSIMCMTTRRRPVPSLKTV